MARHEPDYLAALGSVALEAAALESELVLTVTHHAGGSELRVARLVRDLGASRLLDLLGEWWKTDKELARHRKAAKDLLQKRNDFIHSVAAWQTGPKGESRQILYAARDVWGKPFPMPTVSELRHLAIDLSNEKFWFNRFKVRQAGD